MTRPRMLMTGNEQRDVGEDLENAVTGMEEVLQDSVMTADAFQRFPQLIELDERDMIIMMSVAHGFSYRYIAKAVKVSVATVARTVAAVDPEGIYRLDEDAKKAFLKNRAMSIQAEAMGAITPEKLDECSAPAASKVVKTMAEVAAIQDRKENNLNDKRIKSLTVTFDTDIDCPTAEIIEE